MHLKFSQDLESLLKQLARQPLTLGHILAETSERSFSLIVGLLVLPFLIPMPPGLSGVLGFACFILAIQMAMGRHSPWLPKKIAQFKFPRYFTQQLLNNLKRFTRWLERVVRPRWQKIAENPYILRINGFCIAWLAILLMLPIPFTNPFPTVTILLLAVATLEGDGLLMSLGYGLTLLVTLFFVFIGYAFWQSADWLPNFFK